MPSGFVSCGTPVVMHISIPSRHCIRRGTQPGCTWLDATELLLRQNVGLLAMPNLQSGLLDRSGERESQGPRHYRLKPEMHIIQAGGCQLIGLTPRQKGNPWNSSGDGSQETPHRGVGHLVHRQQALVVGDQRPRGVYKLLRIHSRYALYSDSYIFIRSFPSFTFVPLSPGPPSACQRICRIFQRLHPQAVALLCRY